MADSGRAGADAAWMPPASPAPAEELAGYVDLVEVGRGGDSVVYRARQVALNRDVAVKVLAVDDPERVARFAREVEITVELGRQHPNIVTVLATGTTESGRPAIVMDYHEAGSLHDRLRAEGPLPAEEVATIGAVLADALAFAHGKGVLHRDVKPQNVLVLPTSWVLADFGIARLVDSEHTSSAETFTYRHAAPQILDGLPPTAADDIWSLGSTLYTLADGRPPFASEDPDDDSALAYLRRARIQPHRPLVVPGAAALAPIIDRCLAKDIAGRWPDAGALRDALRAIQHRHWEPAATAERPHPAPEVSEAEPEPKESTDTEPTDTEPTDSRWAPDRSLPTPTPPTPASSAPPSPLPPSADLVGEVPVALSALAQAPAAHPDEDPTGAYVPVDRSAEPGAGDAAPADPVDVPGPVRRRRPRRATVVFAAGALAVGLVLGLGGAVLRATSGEDTDNEPDGPTSPGPSAVPTLTGEPSPTGDEPQPNPADPDLAFLLSEATNLGTSLKLAWRDPSGGEGVFVLNQTMPEQKPLFEFGVGTSEAEVPYVAPPGRSCYVMTVVLASGAYGVSNRRCVNG